MKKLLVSTVLVFVSLNYMISSCPEVTPIHNISVVTSRGATEMRVPKLAIVNTPINEIANESVLIFNPDNVTQSSGATAEYLDLAIQGTGLDGLGEAYVGAEKDYGINAIFLLSITVLESGWGESRLAVEKNNVSGFRAYDSDPYNSATIFTTKEQSIRRTAEVLSKEYVALGRNTIVDIGKKYARDKRWASKVHSVSQTILKRIENKR